MRDPETEKVWQLSHALTKIVSDQFEEFDLVIPCILALWLRFKSEDGSDPKAHLYDLMRETLKGLHQQQEPQKPSEDLH